MENEKLNTSLNGKELVKPNLSNKRFEQEVESLCEEFACNGFTGDAAGSTQDEHDILF
jgi:hypothetical protein